MALLIQIHISIFLPLCMLNKSLTLFSQMKGPMQCSVVSLFNWVGTLGFIYPVRYRTPSLLYLFGIIDVDDIDVHLLFSLLTAKEGCNPSSDVTVFDDFKVFNKEWMHGSVESNQQQGTAAGMLADSNEMKIFGHSQDAQRQHQSSIFISFESSFMHIKDWCSSWKLRLCH